jgi:hypothetical protein
MRKILEVAEKLSANQAQTHLIYEFGVSGQCRKLHIDFSYSPKVLDNERLSEEIIRESLRKYVVIDDGGGPASEEGWRRFLPLKNLITVSVDDPNGFRGACHRHDPVQHLFVAADFASPGLMPGMLTPGKWSVMLSIHAIVTETCDVQLTVWEGDDV